MKKTIISAALLLGLASAASAADGHTWTSEDLATAFGEGTSTTLTIPQDGSYITDQAQGHFTLTAILDPTKFETAIENNSWGVFLKAMDGNYAANSGQGDQNTDDYSYNLGINGSSSSTTDGIYTGLGGNVHNESLSGTISSYIGKLVADNATTENTFKAIAITLSSGGSGTRYEFTAVTKDGIVYGGSASKGSWHYGTFDLTDIYVTDMVSYLVLSDDYMDSAAAYEANKAAIYTTTGISIPEPATATLSLLALAGLAARRRRH